MTLPRCTAMATDPTSSRRMAVLDHRARCSAAACAIACISFMANAFRPPYAISFPFMTL